MTKNSLFSLKIIPQEIRSFLTIPTQDLNLKTCKTTSAWLSFALKKDVPRLADVLQIPETVRCEQRSVCGRNEGLCMAVTTIDIPM